MSNAYVKYLAIFLVLVVTYSNSFAAAEDDFNEGVEYFKQKQYRQAVKSFTRSHKKGLKTPALFHNLGVSHYKLENYSQARKYFELARHYPEQRMLAEYNLGLVAKKQNKQALAKKHFTLVKKKARDSKLVTLARIQLGEVKALEPEQGWSVYTELGYGHDDNITAVPETTATNKSSNYADIYVSGDVQLLGSPKSGIALTGFVSSFDYIDFDRYDESRLSLGIEGTFRTGGWANSMKISSQEVTYGHTDYQKITRFQAKTTYKLTRNNSLRFRYRYDDISSENPTYDYLAGTRQRFRTELRYDSNNHYARFYHELEKNDRTDRTTESFSPMRNTLRAYYEYSLTNSFKIGGDINYRVSTYPGKAANLEREDTRQRLGLKLTYKFNKIWKVYGKIEETDNESTNPIYSYQRKETLLSLVASF